VNSIEHFSKVCARIQAHKCSIRQQLSALCFEKKLRENWFAQSVSSFAVEQRLYAGPNMSIQSISSPACCCPVQSWSPVPHEVNQFRPDGNVGHAYSSLRKIPGAWKVSECNFYRGAWRIPHNHGHQRSRGGVGLVRCSYVHVAQSFNYASAHVSEAVDVGISYIVQSGAHSPVRPCYFEDFLVLW